MTTTIKYTHPELHSEILPGASGDDGFGRLVSLPGDSDIKIPDLVWPRTLAPEDEKTLEEYEAMADVYDNYAPLPFLTYEEDETEVRSAMLDLLNLTPHSKVLEVGCGTGRGSNLIQNRLSSEGLLVLQEISPGLMAHTVKKLSNSKVPTEFSLANGSYLPFKDNVFDAAHHFGGINTFANIPRCLSELARVVRPGGRVVLGDEGLGPWLADTEFGNIMSNSNPLLKCNPPIESIPPNTANVRLQWILKGAFYLIDFIVTDGPPTANYHLEIPSPRGGSHWTRYHGNLEGVTDEAKTLAYEAQKKSGLSMHDWLEGVVRNAAHDQLKNS